MRAKLSLAVASVLVSVLAAPRRPTRPASGSPSWSTTTARKARPRTPRTCSTRTSPSGRRRTASRTTRPARRRQLRAVPRLHRLRRAHLHRPGQCLLGRRREAEQQAAEQAEVTGETNGEAPPAPGAQSRCDGHCCRSRLPPSRRLPTPTAAARCRRRSDRAGRADRCSGRDAGGNACRSHRHPRRLPPRRATAHGVRDRRAAGWPRSADAREAERTAGDRQDRAAAAAAAASAAAAAERAAAAAETAANAAKEAAAAAVAASAASKGAASWCRRSSHASGAEPAHNE